MRQASVIVVLVSMVTVWYPAATQDLPAINPDNLDPEAAHVCQRTERESYTAKVSFTSYFTQKTSTWCVSFPPRCTEYRIASRTSYRIETRYRNRKTYFCCAGYKSMEGHNYCVPACDHDCYSAEEQGYCVTPGKCKCHPGYKGTYCDSGCESNQWGPDCSKTCNCGTHGSCDPENGNCICSIGYTGQTCSQKCVDSFGLHCVHPCACENDAICDNVNGKCTCQPGWYGAYCHKKCDSTTAQEEGCEQECPCQNGGVCHGTTNACICPPGVKGQYCTELCDAFHWGVNCTEQCTCNFGKCNSKYGTCTCDHGYAGDSCQVKCPDGFYGAGCLTPCGCKNEGKCYRNEATQMVECSCDNTGYHGDVCSVRDCPDGKYLLPGSGQTCQNCTCDWRYTESCHPLTGTCSCKPGYTGNQCTEKCTMPFYGKDCAEVCECAHGDCDHVTGSCTTCYPGYIGTNCDKECKKGTWGMDCVNNCTCLNGARCHVKSGYCECKPGYAGINCETYCEVGRYGQDCMGTCTCDTDRSSCSPVNGQCLCKPGFIGERCKETCKQGTYGYYCISECACSPQGTKSCDSRTGFCHCKGGWSGKLCDKLCSDSYWGPNCVNKCKCNGNGNCHGDTGDCLCYSGYSGRNCEYKDGIEVVAQQTGGDASSASTNMTPLIVGIVVPCVLLLLILALVVAYYMRKVRFLKEENLRVHYQANGTLPGHTVIPNGNAGGLINPTYVEDNARNERRYPHLSQRASGPPPPLPHRQQSCDPCDDIDVEKLRVQINGSGTRPVSSQYADIDDLEDRYTTLKSMAGASSAAASDSKSDTLSEGQRSRSSSKTSEVSFGFSNKGYVDMDGTAHGSNSTDHSIGGLSQPLYDNNEKSANNTDLDQPDALSATSSTDTNKNPTGQASKEYDFPKSTRLSSINLSNQDVSQSLTYTNSIFHPSLESQDTKNKRENPYDTPSSSLSKQSENTNRTPAANGYLTPQNDVNSNNSFA